MHFIVSYLSIFSDYCKTVLRIIKKRVFLFTGADSKQPLGADS